jgi:predicted DNA-binding ArsR family transcriptional regulator
MRAFDTPVKKEIFKEIQHEWKPLSEIRSKYGENGEKALEFFDSMKLVETRWSTSEEGINGKPQKKYRSYYSAFNINISCPVNEISDIFTIASLNDADFVKLEQDIYDFLGEEGKFSNTVSEHFHFSTLVLKSIVKRSDTITLKGLKVVRK